MEREQREKIESDSFGYSARTMRRQWPILLMAAVLLPLAVGCGQSSKDQPRGRHSSTPATTAAHHPTPTKSARAGAARAPATAAPAQAVPAPRIVKWFIPFPPKRKREMEAYARRHYGINSFILSQPRVIIEHVSATSTARSVYETFANDMPDSELHELPQVCAHFVVGHDGTIYQLVPLRLMCRHAVGMNYTAIGIEHVGMSDADVLGDARQLRASLALTTWLRCRFQIRIADVIGHNEILSSPYHHERVARLRKAIHDDMKPPTMRRYRAALRKRNCGQPAATPPSGPTAGD